MILRTLLKCLVTRHVSLSAGPGPGLAGGLPVVHGPGAGLGLGPGAPAHDAPGLQAPGQEDLDLVVTDPGLPPDQGL